MTRLAGDNTLARVMQLVAEAQEHKSPTQRFTETFARRFAPAVLMGTFVVIVIPPLVLGWTWSASPPLAAATVGMAMGAGGTAVALETADVVFMGDDLGKLSFAIGLSRASARIIRQNLVIALGVIALLLIASGFGVIPLSVAVVLHEGSSIVVLNALRLPARHEPAAQGTFA